MYAYKNWFNTKEQSIIEPFLIQSEYTDESFTATDDIDIETASDPTQYVMTNQGTITIEEYNNATSGHYVKYICGSGSTDYKATPFKFDEDVFRSFLCNLTSYQVYSSNKKAIAGTFVVSYDGTYWSLADNSEQVLYQVRVYSNGYPTGYGITADTHNGSYTYTPKSGDYILIKLYSDTLEIIDTTTIAVQLAQQGYDVLETCSQPAFSFDISAANFILLPDYAEWTEDLGFNVGNVKLGTELTVINDDGTVYYPFVQEISFEFDNPDSLTFTFGNKFNLGTSEYTLGQLLSETTSITQRTQRALIGTASGSGSGSGSDSSGTSASSYSNSTAIDSIAKTDGLIDSAVRK